MGRGGLNWVSRLAKWTYTFLPCLTWIWNTTCSWRKAAFVIRGISHLGQSDELQNEFFASTHGQCDRGLCIWKEYEGTFFCFQFESSPLLAHRLTKCWNDWFPTQLYTLINPRDPVAISFWSHPGFLVGPSTVHESCEGLFNRSIVHAFVVYSWQWIVLHTKLKTQTASIWSIVSPWIMFQILYIIYLVWHGLKSVHRPPRPRGPGYTDPCSDHTPQTYLAEVAPRVPTTGEPWTSNWADELRVAGTAEQRVGHTTERSTAG